jgi:hypothetical protein
MAAISSGPPMRRERPRRRRAAEQRDELATFQLIELHSISMRVTRYERKLPCRPTP